MNITLQEYASLKRQIAKELDDVINDILDLFDGKMFDHDIYSNFDDEQKKLHSVLRQIMDNLNGQLTAFERLEGVEKTKLDVLINWKNQINKEDN